MRSFNILQEIDRWHAGDEAALERLGPPTPRHQAIGGARKEFCTLDERRPADDVELAEHVGPRTVAAHGGAWTARAIREAPDRPDHDSGAYGRRRGRCRKDCTRARLGLRLARAPAGDADVD